MTNAENPAALERPSAPWTSEKVLFNVPAVVALLADHDRRVADLLEANNRYQQEARDARTEGKKLFDAMRLMGEYAVKLSEAIVAEKGRADAAEIAAASADASWRETLRKERDARLHEVRLKEAGRIKIDQWKDKADGLQSDLECALEVLVRRINGEADLASAAEWVRLNYPLLAARLNASPDTAPAATSHWQPTHLHVKGGLYRKMMTAIRKADLEALVIYDDAHGEVWARPATEFMDGRFKLLTVDEQVTPGSGDIFADLGVEPPSIPFRLKDIERGLILFRTSSNAHGSVNFVALSEKIDSLPQVAKDELASLMRNFANGLSPSSFRIEDGKFYITRDGRKVGPMRGTGAGQFLDQSRKITGQTWHPNGLFIGGRHKSAFDLMVEIAEPEANG